MNAKLLESFSCCFESDPNFLCSFFLLFKKMYFQKDTQMKMVSVLQELCGEDCKMEIYQEDNTDEVLVSGKYVEGQ